VFENEFLPGAGFLQDFEIICACVALPQKHYFHAGFLERECQLVRAVCGIYIHEGRARPGAREVNDHPFDAVGGPEADAVATANTQSSQTTGHGVGGFAEFTPGKPFGLVAGNQGEVIAELLDDAVELLTDRVFPKRLLGTS